MTTPSPPAPSSLSEVLFQGLTRAAGIGILTLVATLVAVLVVDSWPVLSRAGDYQLFTSSEWVTCGCSRAAMAAGRSSRYQRSSSASGPTPCASITAG